MKIVRKYFIKFNEIDIMTLSGNSGLLPIGLFSILTAVVFIVDMILIIRNTEFKSGNK